MKYFIIAGEASGDLHASNLMREIKQVDTNSSFYYFGGDLMQQQGGTLLKHYRSMAFMGFVAVAKNLKTVLRNLSDCKKAIREVQPDVIILVDYPSFNLRIAQFAKEELQLPVYYYISPKIWAWKEHRIKQIKKYIDKMFTIFPFETSFYAHHNYTVEYVGNPTIDSLTPQLQNMPDFEDFISKNKLPNKGIVTLAPGSRRQEISNCLPTMIKSVQSVSDLQLVIAGAPGIEADFYEQFCKQHKLPVIFDQTYALLHHSQFAVVNSGTATLETAIIGTPQVVVYHVHFGKIMRKVKDIVLKVKHISLVNIIAQKEVVKELYADLFTVENLEKEVAKLKNDTGYCNTIKAEYQKIRKELGEPGAPKRAAIIIYESLKKEQ